MTITEKPESRDVRLKRLHAELKEVDAQIKELKTRRTNGADRASAGLQQNRRRFHSELNARRVSLAAAIKVTRKSLAEPRAPVIDKKQVKALRALIEHMHECEANHFKEGHEGDHIYRSVAVLKAARGLGTQCQFRNRRRGRKGRSRNSGVETKNATVNRSFTVKYELFPPDEADRLSDDPSLLGFFLTFDWHCTPRQLTMESER
jgi:hypothetical protein